MTLKRGKTTYKKKRQTTLKANKIREEASAKTPNLEKQRNLALLKPAPSRQKTRVIIHSLLRMSPMMNVSSRILNEK